ncbi:sensor histidine kinase [Arundinibacter roseus]|uniref:Sensor histidine kinase n=1 Tax=Arundinibacter roseus TaxID=2070510 RepID=A0A4R4KIE1_9BACT|nr:sensor histidine kinase [Arundinibacter roseus]TDB67937.1 sensor histidine kinase [Arundinibacter roseus]
MQSYEALRILLDGMLYMMALFSVMSFLQQRKAIYWQYAVYIVCITFTFNLNDQDYLKVNYLPGTNFLISLLESVAFAMYISFAIQLMNIQENDPVSYRILRYMILVLILETVVDCFLFSFEFSPEIISGSYTFFRFILAGTALVVLPRIFRLRQAVVSYFIIGTFLFVIGCLLALWINYIPAIFTRSPDSPFSFPITYMELGVVAEVLCFTLGMSLQNRENELEKIKVQGQLIVQLRENDQKQQKLLKIRDEIARDLHDELGADLASISMMCHAAEQQLTLNPELARKSIRQMGETARKVIRVMREIVWSLHSAHDSAGQFVHRIRETAQGLFDPNTTTLHFDVGLTDATIPSVMRRDLFLIYKELLHNALRHSSAANVYISFEIREQQIFLSVRDDGQGFDPEVGYHGNGLASIRQRAASLNGHLAITSHASQGTRATLNCPLPA